MILEVLTKSQCAAKLTLLRSDGLEEVGNVPTIYVSTGVAGI